MTICGISQPVYLPWIGYFCLVLQSDHFVFLDDAQFSKNTFGNRNRIPTKNGPIWLTIPVRHQKLEQNFQETYFDENQNWRKKHIKTVQQVYSNSPFFKQVFPVFESKILNLKLNSLATLSIELTTAFVDYLGIKKTFHLSSDLKVPGKRSEKILNICRKLDCNTYLSAEGAEEYIREDQILLKSGLKIKFMKIRANPYPQISSSEFVSHMSTLDLLMNMGPQEAADFILDSNPN